MIGFIAGFFAGGFFGVVLMCILAAAGRSDEITDMNDKENKG
ncbi:DUF3789 domain-containing protein [Ruminococcus sp.]|nr:DUF3789 domain-containing protein [Ruminococcus sp.]MEE1263044.1 DUF3789 domain-containing protein [Ruminococcus sp.]